MQIVSEVGRKLTIGAWKKTEEKDGDNLHFKVSENVLSKFWDSLKWKKSKGNEVLMNTNVP